MAHVKNILQSIFTVDRRALAITRIGIGGVLLIDLVIRLIDIQSMLTDTGVMPRSYLWSFWSDGGHFSLHAIGGSTLFAAGLILFQILMAIFLIYGYRTRLVTFISWILLISLHTRMPLILNGGDLLLRMLLFWGMFMPWGEYMSFDYLKNKIKEKKSHITVGTIGFMTQAASMYFFTGLLKNDPEWTEHFIATEYVLRNSQFATDFGTWLTQFPELLQFLTASTLYLEIIGGALLLLPFFIKQLRPILFILFLILQIGIMLTMDNVGIFGLVSIIALIPFLPTSTWDFLTKKLQNFCKTKKQTIYYDNDCSFCLRMSKIISAKLFLAKKVKIKKAQSNAKMNSIMLAEHSWVIENNDGTMHTHYDGFLQLLKNSFWKYTYPLFAFPLTKIIGNKIYRHIASHRHTVCLPQKRNRKTILSVIGNSFGIIMIIYMIAANIDYIESVPDFIPQNVKQISYYWNINQGFPMFAPYPTKSDGYFVVKGVLENDEEIDLFTGSKKVESKQLTYNRPLDGSTQFKNNRWWRYFSNTSSSRYKYFRKPYLTYICNEWNSKNDIQLDTLSFLYVYEKVTLHDEPDPGTSQFELEKITCST